jgi:hypothetical protein
LFDVAEAEQSKVLLRCDTCGFVCARTEYMANHRQLHTVKPFQCGSSNCPRIYFENSQQLNEHLAKRHGNKLEVRSVFDVSWELRSESEIRYFSSAICSQSYQIFKYRKVVMVRPLRPSRYNQNVSISVWRPRRRQRSTRPRAKRCRSKSPRVCREIQSNSAIQFYNNFQRRIKSTQR